MEEETYESLFNLAEEAVVCLQVKDTFFHVELERETEAEERVQTQRRSQSWHVMIRKDPETIVLGRLRYWGGLMLCEVVTLAFALEFPCQDKAAADKACKAACDALCERGLIRMERSDTDSQWRFGYRLTETSTAKHAFEDEGHKAEMIKKVVEFIRGDPEKEYGNFLELTYSVSKKWTKQSLRDSQRPPPPPGCVIYESVKEIGLNGRVRKKTVEVDAKQKKVFYYSPKPFTPLDVTHWRMEWIKDQAQCTFKNRRCGAMRLSELRTGVRCSCSLDKLGFANWPLVFKALGFEVEYGVLETGRNLVSFNSGEEDGRNDWWVLKPDEKEANAEAKSSKKVKQNRTRRGSARGGGWAGVGDWAVDRTAAFDGPASSTAWNASCVHGAYWVLVPLPAMGVSMWGY